MAKLFVLFTLMLLGRCELLESYTENTLETASATIGQSEPKILTKQNEKNQSNDIEEFQNVLVEYAKNVINRDTIYIVPGVYIQKKLHNETAEEKSLDQSFLGSVVKFTRSHTLRVDLARATSATGRLFFFKGFELT